MRYSCVKTDLVMPPALHEDSRSRSSLCDLCVLCVSVVDEFRVKPHHRDTEDTEIAQRNPRTNFCVKPMHSPPVPSTGSSSQDLGTPALTHPGKNKHCVLDSRNLLFGSFPCEVASQYCPVLPWPLHCDATSRVAIIGVAAVLPDGSDDRELHPFTWLA